MKKDKQIICLESGKCFARSNGFCRILQEGYEKEGQCAFKKPVQGITNGVRYSTKLKEWGMS